MRIFTLATASVFLISPVLAQETKEPANTGQDITNPVTRIDLRAGYQRTPTHRDSGTFILRADKPYDLGDGWKLGLRFDAPFVLSNVPSPDNPIGGTRLGMGDLLGQAILIKAIDKRNAFGFGAQIILPSASEDQFGGGKYRLVPTLGYRYGLPEISPGSFFVGAVRYDFDIAGPGNRKHVRSLQFGPTLNIALPEQTFVTFFPSTDIRYDFIAKSWFVPFNLQFGKLWGKSVVTSVEFAVPIYKGTAPLYNYRAEARLGVFF
jgi:hypothetical protein